MALASPSRVPYADFGARCLIRRGTLVAYPNSVPPLINHWTPAFPAFYVALAVPVGAWITAGETGSEAPVRWGLSVTGANSLLGVGWGHFPFFFPSLLPPPRSPKNKTHQAAP